MRAYPISLLLLWFASQGSALAANLTVVVEGVRSRDGILRLALFTSGKGFPADATHALAHQTISLAQSATGQPAVVVFENLAPGPFAVSVFHDENGDGTLQKNWFGMPREGIGASNNNVADLRGSPKFESAVFNLERDMRIAVRLAYPKP